jgi:hypothetical protein
VGRKILVMLTVNRLAHGSFTKVDLYRFCGVVQAARPAEPRSGAFAVITFAPGVQAETGKKHDAVRDYASSLHERDVQLIHRTLASRLKGAWDWAEEGN